MQDKKLNPLIKLSASSIKTYESCPRKFFYTYIDKLPRKKWDHLELGTFCHAVLEQFHDEWNKDKNSVLVELMIRCFADQRKNYAMNIEQLEEAKSLLQEYLFIVEKNGMPNTLFIEEAFEFNVGEFILRGFIDRVDMDKDGIFHIVDYKTSKNEKYLDNFQLLIYCLAMKNRYPNITQVRGSYVLLRKGSRYITEEFNLHDIDKCEKQIMEFGNLIAQEKKWAKNPSPLCNWCDFYSPCQDNEWINEDTLLVIK